jgi:sulfotransferase
MKKYYLISGTPRSGSTMFSAILNQNPRFHSAPTTMLFNMFENLFLVLNKHGHGVLIPELKRKNLLKGLFESYYNDVDKEVIFDTNRAWTALSHIIPAVDSNMRYICLVREIPLILNSFEKAYLNNPLHRSKVYGDDYTLEATSEDRCAHIYQSKLFMQVKLIKEIIKSRYKDNFLFVEYEYLCENPNDVLKNVYDFIGEPYFEHDFNNLASEHYLMDLIDNSPNFHTTEPVLRKIQPRIEISNEVLNQYNIGKYWIL